MNIKLLSVAVGLVALSGCGPGSTELSSEEQKHFSGASGKTSAPRSDAASKGIADFRKNFEAQHGKGNGPDQVQRANPGGG